MVYYDIKMVDKAKSELEAADKNFNEALDKRNKADQEFSNIYQNYMNNCSLKELFETYQNKTFNSVQGHWRDIIKAIEFRLEKYGYHRYGPLVFGFKDEENNKKIILQVYRKNKEWEEQIGKDWREYFDSLDYEGLKESFTNLCHAGGIEKEIKLIGEYLSYEDAITVTQYLEKNIKINDLKEEINSLLDKCEILEKEYENNLNKYFNDCYSS